ncbi:GNAT family N-acetyltransferase [Treponema sp. R80B11-R83G3]
MQINIRKALWADIAIMTSIYNESINIFPENIRRESEYDLLKDLFISNIVYIAEILNTNEHIGWISYNNQSNYTFISGLYLLSKEQRKGIGTELLEYCINILSKENRRLIILNVLKIAPWSIDFYKKNGFNIYDSSISYNENYNILKTRIVNNWELMMYKWI